MFGVSPPVLCQLSLHSKVHNHAASRASPLTAQGSGLFTHLVSVQKHAAFHPPATSPSRLPPLSLPSNDYQTAAVALKLSRGSKHPERSLSKDVSHRTLSECSPFYLLGYISTYMYRQDSQFIAFGDEGEVVVGGGRLKEREAKERRKGDTKEGEKRSSEEKRTKGGGELCRWR